MRFKTDIDRSSLVDEMETIAAAAGRRGEPATPQKAAPRKQPDDSRDKRRRHMMCPAPSPTPRSVQGAQGASRDAD